MAVGWRWKGSRQRWTHPMEQLCARKRRVAILFCFVWLFDGLLCPGRGSAVREGWASVLEATRRRGREWKRMTRGEM